ncbi:MAG: lysophospholipid acyltransferase family protein, partial [Flavobacteriaceae bacterium]|nr:lysophospholipid acyltransferase family protein [Flavobacteriaceae bacterium]
MSLVSPAELANATALGQLGATGRAIAWLLMQVLGIQKINKIYDRYKHLEGLEFLTALLDEFKVNYDLPEDDLDRIPKNGAFITVSNHPLGGIDGVLLLKILLEKRTDFKVIANFLLHRIEPLKPYVLPVNPFNGSQSNQSSIKGFKQALTHLNDGAPLGIFPAGEVSTIKEGEIYMDKEWEIAAIKLIKKAEVPVVPIYFHAKNSRTFYRLAAINDSLRTAKLPSELLSQEQKPIRIRIGNPIKVSEQQQFESVEDLRIFLRTKTYMLSKAYQRDRNITKQLSGNLKLNKPPKKIIGAPEQHLLVEEVEALRKADKRLLQSNQYEVFLSTKKLIPNILQEIGRLREITFRAVGEGTNKSIDLDHYDNYYHHMLLWDNEAKCVAGAYRMGIGEEIYDTYGIEGFYLNELFRFEIEMHKIMRKSIEMGRAFITKEYQQRPMPLFLLWKGIVHTTLRFPNHRYLIGGVSISNKFSKFSKSLMIEFMKSNYYDPYVAQFVKARKEFKVKLEDADKEFLFDAGEADLNKFDKLIDEIEPGEMRLP